MNKKIFFVMTAAAIVSMAMLTSCKKDKKDPVITITTQPAASADVIISGTERLSVVASVTEGAMLQYQWYSNTTNSNTSGTEIGGATTASYDIPTNLAEGTYYYFCEVRALGAESKRSSVTTVTVKDGVLINGITWATRNVDAPGTFAEKPESLGMLYQWNRRIGWSATDPITSSPSGNTWNNTAATGISWTTANDPCPAGWRLPTKEDFEKLVAAGSTWAPRNGVAGRSFGSGANTIFLPAVGCRVNGLLQQVDELGAYSSRTEASPDTRLNAINFNATLYIMATVDKKDGFSCRCVKN